MKIFGRAVLVLLIFFSIFSFSSPLLAQDHYLPVATQLRLILKVITFERNLRNNSELVMGIIHHEGYSPSMQVKNEMIQAIEKNQSAAGYDFSVRFVVFELHDENGWENRLEENNIHFLYISPMTVSELESVLEICNSRKIPTFTGIQLFVDEGVAIGFRRNGKENQILVNYSAANNQGLALSSRLLHLAKFSGTLKRKREMK